MTPAKLNAPEINALRAKAQRGPLTPEEVALFVASSRASFTALPGKTPKALTSKAKKAESTISENQIDFF
jgi:hypothetical protein